MDVSRQTLQRRVEGKGPLDSDGVTYYRFTVDIPVNEAEGAVIARTEEMWKALLPGQLQCNALYFDIERALKYQKEILLVSQERLKDFAEKRANRFASYRIPEGYLLQGTQEQAMSAGFMSKWDDMLLRYTHLYSDLRYKLDSLMRNAKVVQDHLEHDCPDDGTIDWPIEPTPLGECQLAPMVGFLGPDHLNQVARVVDHTPPVPTDEYRKYLVTQVADLCRCLRESDGMGNTPKEGEESISGERLRNLMGIFVLSARKEAKRQGLSASDYLLGSVAFAQNVLKFLLTYFRIVPSPKASEPTRRGYPRLVPVDWHVVLAMSESLFERLPPPYYHLQDLVQNLAAISRALRLPIKFVTEANRNEAVAALINVCGLTLEQAMYRVHEIILDQDKCIQQAKVKSMRDSLRSVASSRWGSEYQSLRTGPLGAGSDLEPMEANTPGVGHRGVPQMDRLPPAQTGTLSAQYNTPAFDFGVPSRVVSGGIPQIVPGVVPAEVSQMASVGSPQAVSLGVPQIILGDTPTGVSRVAPVGLSQVATGGVTKIVPGPAFTIDPQIAPGVSPVGTAQVIRGIQADDPWVMPPGAPPGTVPVVMPGVASTVASVHQYPSVVPVTGISFPPGFVCTMTAPVIAVPTTPCTTALTSLDMPIRHSSPNGGFPQVAIASSMTPIAAAVASSSDSWAYPRAVAATIASEAQTSDFRYGPRSPQ